MILAAILIAFTSALVKLRAVSPHGAAPAVLDAFVQVVALMGSGGLQPSGYEGSEHDGHAVYLLLLTGLFLLAIPIVLFNALIALLGDIFDRVRLVSVR